MDFLPIFMSMHQQEFLDYLQYEKRYSEHTCLAYQTDLRQYRKYLSEDYEIDDIHDVGYRIIRSWIVSMIEGGLTPRTINRKISTLKTFYRFLKRQGIVEENPMQKILSPKVAKRLPVFVEESKMQFLFDEVEFTTDYAGARDKLILELLYATGMRVSELVNLKVSDISFSTQSLKVLGKRNKERLIPFTHDFHALLRNYLTIRDQENKSASSPYLLLASSGDKLRREFVYRQVKHYLGLVTTANKKSPHVLRHTFATHMLNNGADLNSIKEILGHANLSATQVYTHTTIEKLKSVHNSAHPRSKKR
jgi:integrase/recombinase XerC